MPTVEELVDLFTDSHDISSNSDRADALNRLHREIEATFLCETKEFRDWFEREVTGN